VYEPVSQNSCEIQVVSKRALQLWNLIYIYSEDMYSVLSCSNVAKHTEFYLGYLRLNVTSSDNAEYLKNSFTMIFQKLLRGEC
jgi:hypothetical protein